MVQTRPTQVEEGPGCSLACLGCCQREAESADLKFTLLKCNKRYSASVCRTFACTRLPSLAQYAMSRDAQNDQLMMWAFLEQLDAKVDRIMAHLGL